VSPDSRPDRHALLELHALLTQIDALRSEGDAARFSADARYRWVLHRLWIAAGNEALAYTQATGSPYAPTGSGPTSTTCATTSPTPGSPTSTKGSSAGSPGPASAPSAQPPGTTCKHSPSQAHAKPPGRRRQPRPASGGPLWHCMIHCSMSGALSPQGDYRGRAARPVRIALGPVDRVGTVPALDADTGDGPPAMRR
jgi:hypothetical protein